MPRSVAKKPKFLQEDVWMAQEAYRAKQIKALNEKLKEIEKSLIAHMAQPTYKPRRP